MLFHIMYQLTPENRNAAQKRFMETGGLPPGGVKMVGRWHATLIGNQHFRISTDQ